MLSFRSSEILPFMFRNNFRLYSSALTSKRIAWDPTVSLNLKHPTLVLLEICRTNEHFKQILAQMMRLHLTTQTFPMSRLLYFSAVSHPENLNDAILLFNHFTPHRNLYIYNIMIAALSFSPTQAISLYKSMLQSCIYPDEHSLLHLLKSCKDISAVRLIHAHVIISGLGAHCYLQNSLIKVYLENGRVDFAQDVFIKMPKKDTVSWNIMISGHAKKECSLEAVEYFHEMVVTGIQPDQYTMLSLLICCGQLKDALLGRSVHGSMVRNIADCSWGLILSNSLLDMYARCEEMKMASRVFDGVDKKDCVSWNIMIRGFANVGELDVAHRFFCEMPTRDIVSWNSLLFGYSQKGDSRKVMELFSDMLAEDVKPDKVSAISLVCAAADIGDLSFGRCIHAWVVKMHDKIDAFVSSALIDMYCKCGNIEKSHIIFKTAPGRDVTVWTSIIAGLAFHGHGVQALELFEKMHEDGIMPNSVTLITVLTACSHAGLVDRGYRIFENMKQVYGVEIGIEHYGCMVDILARSGRLTEAIKLIRRMPMKPSRSIWGAILSSSKAHGNIELAEVALKELIKLEPGEEGGYVLLSNLYATYGRWNYSDKIREVMGSRGLKKTAGCSSVAVDGVIHDFFSSDKRHSRLSEVYCILYSLHRDMRSAFEVPLSLVHRLQESELN